VFLRLQTKFAILYQVVISEIFFRQNHLNKLSAFSPNVIFGILSVHRKIIQQKIIERKIVQRKIIERKIIERKIIERKIIEKSH
jgi:hypothetical protein